MTLNDLWSRMAREELALWTALWTLREEDKVTRDMGGG